MIRSKFIKAFILGMCITVFSTTAILAAGTGGGQSSADQGQKTDNMTIAAGSPGSTEPSPALSEEILKKQSEIDQYLFEKHKEEIAEKGITVTHTVPFEKYVEIGITPYNEENAEFLYKIFGKETVKIVEGQQATLMTANVVGAADTPASSPQLDIPDVNEEVIKKQSEIDLYLFEQHKDEIAEKGITVTHTSPTYNYVEIGITPYNEENAEYLYKAFGKDLVKVVEGQQSNIMTTAVGAPDIAVYNPELDKQVLSEDDNKAELYTATAARETKDASGRTSTLILTILAVGTVAVLGGTFIVIRRRKVTVK